MWYFLLHISETVSRTANSRPEGRSGTNEKQLRPDKRSDKTRDISSSSVENRSSKQSASKSSRFSDRPTNTSSNPRKQTGNDSLSGSKFGLSYSSNVTSRSISLDQSTVVDDNQSRVSRQISDTSDLTGCQPTAVVSSVNSDSGSNYSGKRRTALSETKSPFSSSGSPSKSVPSSNRVQCKF